MNQMPDRVASKGMIPKEIGKKLLNLRTYDIVDIFTIGVFNLIVFSLGFSLGWLVWGSNAHL